MNTSRSKVTILQIAVLVLVVGFVTYAGPERNPHFEATFADQTDSGLAVVPASGVSQTSYTGTYTATYGGYEICYTALEGGWDAYGNILYSGYTSRWLYKNGYSKCLSNYTANTFFVPNGSGAETAAFIASAPGLGITVNNSLR